MSEGCYERDWQNYIDEVEDIRLTSEGKLLYSLRKETIERCFGTAKEHHAMRYTQQLGKLANLLNFRGSLMPI